MFGYCTGGHAFSDAENTYAGSGNPAGTPRAAVNFWFNDPPHEQTLSSTSYTEHRIAIVVGWPFNSGGNPADAATFVDDFGACTP